MKYFQFMDINCQPVFKFAMVTYCFFQMLPKDAYLNSLPKMELCCRQFRLRKTRIKKKVTDLAQSGRSFVAYLKRQWNLPKKQDQTSHQTFVNWPPFTSHAYTSYIEISLFVCLTMEKDPMTGNWFYPLWKLIGFTIGCSIKFAIITNECCFNTVEKKRSFTNCN